MQGIKISEMASLPESAERLLRPAEVAEMLGVSTHTLKAWRHRGFGPRYKRFPGERGQIRYLHSEVVEFMKEGLNSSYARELSRRPRDGDEEQEGDDSPEVAERARREAQGQ